MWHKWRKTLEGTYTSRVLSGISAGIKVKMDKNQQASNTNTGIPDFRGIDLKR